MADALNDEWLPPEFLAVEHPHAGAHLEIDVATFEHPPPRLAAPCAVGAPLPVMPLRLTGDLFVPVDFEATYQEACRRRRII